MFPGLEDREHYKVVNLFLSFLVFLPLTELIMLVVYFARKPVSEDAAGSPKALSDAACKLLTGLQRACARVVDKFQEVAFAENERAQLPKIYKSITYLPTMVLLVLAGSAWQGRYRCSFTGDDPDVRPFATCRYNINHSQDPLRAGSAAW